MKYTLKLANKEVLYDENSVYIDGNVWATYNDKEVIWTATSSKIAELNCYRDHSWALVESLNRCIFEAHNRDNSLRNQSEHNKLLGKYTGPHTGALASYIAYEYYLTLPATETKQKATKSVQNNEKTEVKEPVAQKAVKQEAPVEAKPIPIKKKQPTPPVTNREPEPKYIPPKQEPPQKEFIYEEPPVYKPPEETRKESYDYKPKIDRPTIQIPSSDSSEHSGCLGIAIGIFVVAIAIKLIPKSWDDLDVYIPEGDIGMTICFFSAVIGAIIALLRSIFSDSCKLGSCLTTFLIPCVIGIVINIFVLFKDIIAGDYEFTGFILFDLPLAIFAPILGCFQFAFPIGIAVTIICGIICFFKK